MKNQKKFVLYIIYLERGDVKNMEDKLDRLITDLSRLLELSRFYYYDGHEEKHRKRIKKTIKKLKKIKKEGGIIE